MDPVDNVAQNTSMAGFSLVMKRKIVFHLIYHYLPAGEGGGPCTSRLAPKGDRLSLYKNDLRVVFRNEKFSFAVVLFQLYLD